jgi:DNA-binding NarL/FixJ family response regulator
VRAKQSRERAPETIRVLIVEHIDEDAELAEYALMRAHGSCLFERAASRDAMVDAMRNFAPDVVVTAHELPDLDAMDALRIVNQTRPGTPVMVAADSSGLNPREFLRNGATDCFLKGTIRNLGKAIEAALELRAPLRKLSPRQTEILRLLAKGESASDIARRLRISVKTVEAHRAEVMRRLGLRNLAGLVHYAVSVGLVPVEN